MTRSNQETDHAWLVMMKAMRALTRYAAAGIEETRLGLSDFGVLEVLLNKGPLPVNTIGPIVDLTPGSISIAVDRLFAKGYPAWEGPHRSGFQKAFRADEESVI